MHKQKKGTSIDHPLYQEVVKVAEKEKRTFRSMINVLVEEALKKRKSSNKTPMY